MNALLLTCIVIGISMQNIIKKYYNEKIKFGAYTFVAISVAAASFFFACSASFDLTFSTDYLGYSAAFAATYAVAVVFSFLAITSGPLSITALMFSYSLVIPTLYGMIFLGEEASVTLIIGLCLLAVSLFLINSRTGGGKITLKWIVYVLLAFLGNGVCTVVQNLQQREFSGLYKSEFMIAALITVVVIVIAPIIICERREFLPSMKRGGILMVLCGVINGASNLLVMLLVNRMNASVLYPVMSAGGVLLTFFVSLFIYKERLAVKQYISFAFGIAAIVLMNI